MLKDFKAFILRGNVVDLAVAVVIGAAFGSIVKSLVDDIIMPPIGLVVGKLDFSNLFLVLRPGEKAAPPYATIAEAHGAGAVTLNYGTFINNIVGFVIIALAIFMMVRLMNRLYAQPAPVTESTKPCPECTLSIPIPAKRCPNCTAIIG